MIKFEFLIVPPEGEKNLPLILEAASLGETGILDLVFHPAPDKALKVFLEEATSSFKGSLGVRIDEEIFLSLKNYLSVSGSFNTVVLVPGEKGRILSRVEQLKKKGFRVILEVVSLEEARKGEEAGVDGILAKGNEAGGRVGEWSSLVLLQKLVSSLSTPLFIQGGVGIHTAPLLYAGGAKGCVIDWQIGGVKGFRFPSPLEGMRKNLRGDESLCVGYRSGEVYRIYTSDPSLPERLEEWEDALLSLPRGERIRKWRERIGELYRKGEIIFLGQDISFASHLAPEDRSMRSLIQKLRENINPCLELARIFKPLGENSGIAHRFGVRFPIVQGPMSRVSDTPEFALSVAREGGLPVMAVGLMPPEEIEKMLEGTRRLLGDYPWGVGLLGFIPRNIFEEQVGIVEKYKPRFAIVAGGKPSQAKLLEEKGIIPYLHVPSPELLRIYLEDGVRNFVFEGEECGGHIGKFSSLVLWEKCVEVLEKGIKEGEEYSVLFAGGIMTPRAVAGISALAGRLLEKGVEIGILLGTGYLFTREAVEKGAILEDFQELLLKEERTVILDMGGGYRVRCLPTPFVKTFEARKRKLRQEGKPPQELREELEQLVLGRLRIAAKGVYFNVESLRNPQVPSLVKVSKKERKREGVYMAGEVVALEDKVITVKELHQRLSIEGTRLLDRKKEIKEKEVRPSPEVKIAVIGMACIYPRAEDKEHFWENILKKVYAIQEVPPERWNWRDYYDPEPEGKDKLRAHWGGFIKPINFDPTRYGIPPKTLASVDPMQILALEVVGRALEDAGYIDKEFDRENTSVIFGASGGMGDFGALYALRALVPSFFEKVPQEFFDQLPVWTEDTFPGLLQNVIAGRIANCFNLGGTNFTVDAACASSLAALYHGIKELILGTSNMVIVGAVDVLQGPFAYFCFEKAGALSPTGEVRPFDSRANGTVISEGVGAVVLKRLEDAIRDGDRIYAVIRGIGSSSDGRGKGLTAPRIEGQARALRRAYKQANFSISTVELIEAHGTGTRVGDDTEARCLEREFRSAGAREKTCAVGSVKSMIGHTKGAAGMASLIKTVLALHHKVLPPTLGVENPHPASCWEESSPLYLNTEPRPWIGSRGVRRAGVSAFGFGGTNFHVVLEEYPSSGNNSFPLEEWGGEIFLWEGKDTEEIISSLKEDEKEIEEKELPLTELSHYLYQKRKKGRKGKDTLRLVLVASSLADLKEKISQARSLLREPSSPIRRKEGIYFSPQPLLREGKLAFLFPGQGSQRPDMLKELTLIFPQMKESLRKADRVLEGRFPRYLSEYIYPPPAFDNETREKYNAELRKTNIAQPALGAVEMGLFRVLESLGVIPDMTAGHSLGEYTALASVGVFSEEELYDLLERRGEAIIRSARDGNLGKMLAVALPGEEVEKLVREYNRVYPANFNSPQQTVLSGEEKELEKIASRLKEKGVRTVKLNVDCAFHSPFMKGAQKILFEKLSSLKISPPRIPVYSNLTTYPYPKKKEEIISILNDHLTHSVRFTQEIHNMYEDGARVFLEVGPGSVLTNLVRRILKGKDFLTLSFEGKTRPEILEFLHVLAQLMAEGMDIDLTPLYRGRVRNSPKETNPGKNFPLWVVAPDRAWPAKESRPMRKKVKIQSPVPLSKERDSLPSLQEKEKSSLPSQVLLRYQKLMTQFLELQKEVMLAYLTGKGEGKASKEIEEKVLQDFEEKIGGELRKEEEREAVKKEEEVKAVSQEKGKEDVRSKLLRIVSDKTGYPEEMLNLELDMESDLGIDSIKKIEIIREFLKSLPGATPELGEKLGSARTMGEILKLVESEVSSPPSDIPRINLRDRLLKVVSEKTGYPEEMLALDLDMERDLGIDSIKKIEIVRSFLEGVPGATPQLGEKLSQAQTLGEILEEVKSLDVAGVYAEDKKEETLPKMSRAWRGIIRLQPRPLSAPSSSSFPSGLTLILGEGTLAVDIRKRIEKEGGKVWMMEGGERLRKAKEVEKLVKEFQKDGTRIQGILHLLPLREAPPLEKLSLREWQEYVDEEVKGLFYLLHYVSIYQRKDTPFLIACINSGGDLLRPIYPWRGGVTGIVKTLSWEWEDSLARALIFKTIPSPDSLWDKIKKELSWKERESEVYYENGSRLVPRIERKEVQEKEPLLDLGEEDVVLALGGARGITAEVLIELAKLKKPVIILAGRSPFPEKEPSLLEEFSSPQEVKRVLWERFKKEGKEVSPKELEEIYQRMLKEREILRTFRELEKAGSRVFYYQVDVRDEEALGNLLEDVYKKFGRIDGVIHGAGIIEDKLLEDKSPESFERVFETKVRSAFLLADKLARSQAKFMIFFSSVAGVFGNRGQIDYAAANDILNRLALYLNPGFRGRVVAISWGPWLKKGMVDEGLRREFEQRGVNLLPSEEGRKAFIQELFYGSKEESLVIIQGE